MLDQVAGPVASFTADGAYDWDSVSDEIAAHHSDAAVVVPPRANAVPSNTAEITPTQRDRHLQLLAERGRTAWQAASGYGWRTLVEADVSRFKRMIGDELRSRTDLRRTTGVMTAFGALSHTLDFARPEYARTA